MRVAEAAAPITDGELDSLLADIAEARSVALAVSGGADSLALLDCVARWRRGRGASPNVTVLTVDHRLRAESAVEAAMVGAVAEARHLRHRILVWEGVHPGNGMEAEARHARYALLLRAAREAGASHLLVAHHRDDQAETFLMRLARGSGLFGLAAMRPRVEAGGVTILRPFLDLPRSRLAATAGAAGLVPAEDPMNRDPRFTRARIRRLMPLFAAEGLDPATLAAVAARLRQAADAIEAAADSAVVRRVATDALAIAWVDPALFVEPAEVRQRVLIRILQAIGGEAYPPRSERLTSLEGAMAAHRRGRFKRTLAGVVAEWRAGRFAFYREIGRAGIEPLALRPGLRATFDGRFAIEAGEGIPPGLVVSALGEDGRLVLGGIAGHQPAGAVAALPAIRRGDAILAVPSLGYASTEVAATAVSIVGDRIARPATFPDFGEG